nr:coiled-coil domain-containing protein 50 isoform X1 [Zootoca vivipara]
MAEISIDQSKLPGVKEVCRDFAVLEDHTLAHSLQEQEIEHHLATNVQRNRLVQYDLQMAKQLQEEEDRKARARIQERHKDLERQDCEIAQEIQVKLVIEAEQRRRQEEDDEDIARILQQKELQEEKRRKKPHPEPLQKSTYDEGYYPESRDHSCGSPREQARPRRAQSGEREPQRLREPRRAPPLFSEGLDLEVLGSSSEARQAGGGRRDGRERQDRKWGGRERPQKPPSDMEEESRRDGDRRERKPSSQERHWRPSSLALDGEVEPPAGSGMGWRERRPGSREGRRRTPPLLLDWEDERLRLDSGGRPRKPRERRSPCSERSPRSTHLSADREERHRLGHSCSPDPGRQRRPPREDRESPKPPSRDPRLQDPEAPAPWRGGRRDGEREHRSGASALPSSHCGEDVGADARHRKDPGTKTRGAKDATYHKGRPADPQDQELYDAEIARKLQEEELLASHVDKRAAQVAQDEEIARLLLAEEKKAYKKAKEREKSSLEKKRQEPDRKHDTHELVRPRSREGHEGHRSRSDKPMRPPPPPSEDLDHLCNLTSQHNLAHQTPRPEPSHKGYHYKQ